MQQEPLRWESTRARPAAGVLLWSSQLQECRLVSLGQWVKNLSVCFSFFPRPPKTVQGRGMVLKQQGSLKLAQCESPIQRFLHGSARALPPSLLPSLSNAGVFCRPQLWKPNPNSQVMEMEVWLGLTRVAAGQLTNFLCVPLFSSCASPSLV